MKSGTDLKLEYKTPEQKLAELFRQWTPPSGYGSVTVTVEWAEGQMIRAIRLNGEESIKLT